MSRTRAEEKLKQASADIHDLYENAPCGYFSVNKDGMVTNMNKTMLHWLGYRKEELVDRLHYSDILKAGENENNFIRVKKKV
ncbi:MAG: PAS domain-containing protein [Bacteroidota bacterium]